MKTLIHDPVQGQKYLKTFETHFKVADTEQGIIEAIVSVFNNVDRGNERVLPGAFKRSLARKLPKVVWMHDWKLPVGKTLAAEELMPGDDRLPEALKLLGGLWVRGQLNLKTQRGREAFDDIAFGAIDEFSIGYGIDKWAMSTTDDVLDLIELELMEWSPVLVGMNDATELLSVKAHEKADEAAIITKFLEGLHDATLEDHSKTVLDAVEGFIGRYKRLAEKKESDGQTFTTAHLERIDAHSAALASLKDLGKAPEAAPSLKADFQRIRWEQEIKRTGVSK